jgi:NAD(P) transhydrogenase beta subunit
MCTSASQYLAETNVGHSLDAVHSSAIFLSMFIGGVTLTGSLTAFAKLQGLLPSSALQLPGRNVANAVLAGANVPMMGMLLDNPDQKTGLALLGGSAATSSLLGVHTTASIGGADMPVVITVLNSYSGWALCAEGFMLQSPFLTIVGSIGLYRVCVCVCVRVCVVVGSLVCQYLVGAISLVCISHLCVYVCVCVCVCVCGVLRMCASSCLSIFIRGFLRFSRCVVCGCGSVGMFVSVCLWVQSDLRAQFSPSSCARR